MPSASERLAAFAAELRFDDAARRGGGQGEAAPARRARCGARRRRAWSSAARRSASARSLGGAADVHGDRFPARLPAVWAALVNGTLAHGLDYDDTHTESVVHVSASVVPAALAACEEAGAGGRDVSRGAGRRAWRRTSASAWWRAAAFTTAASTRPAFAAPSPAPLVGGRLAGLSPAQLADALGLAGSQAAGSLEFLTDGTWAKRIHAGWAAHSGVVAARLAAAGFSGPRGTLDGRFGLYRSHLGDAGWDLAALTDGLGARWELLQIALKPYPCCHFNHAFIDAAAAPARADGIATPDDDRADRVLHLAARGAGRVRARGDASARRRTTTTPSSACRMRWRRCWCAATSTSTTSPTRRSATRRCWRWRSASSTATTRTADFPRRFGGRLRIRLRDGRVVEHHEPINRGSAERPLSEDEVRDKFRRNAGTRAVRRADGSAAGGRGARRVGARRPPSRRAVLLTPRARRRGRRRAGDGAAARGPAHPGLHAARRRAVRHDDARRSRRRDHQDRGSDHRRRRGAQRAAATPRTATASTSSRSTATPAR